MINKKLNAGRGFFWFAALLNNCGIISFHRVYAALGARVVLDSLLNTLKFRKDYRTTDSKELAHMSPIFN